MSVIFLLDFTPSLFSGAGKFTAVIGYQCCKVWDCEVHGHWLNIYICQSITTDIASAGFAVSFLSRAMVIMMMMTATTN